MERNSDKWYGWTKHITIALDVLFLVILLINYLNYLPEFWKITWIFYFVLAINTGFLALKINKIPESERDSKSWIYLISHLFILILVVIAVNQFLKREIITDYMPYIIGVAIATGFLTFYTSKNKVEKELEDEKVNEDLKEKKRKDEFDVKFKWLTKFNLPYGFNKVSHNKNDSLFNKILKLIILTIACPFIFLIRLPYSLTKWMYKEGWVYVLALLLIIILFVAIKYPYMSLDFSGLHDIKYSAYVENAKHMIEHNSILWNERMYITDPITFPSGIYDTFGNYPFMEWGLYATYSLLPNLTIEFATRLFMALIGILTLISMYIFFKWFLTKKQTLIILFILSINFIFQFFTYVTVLDSINILFMFISLIFLINGIEKNDVKVLFLSGVIAGIGVNVKYHALIFYLPIFLSLIYLYKKAEYSEKLAHCLIILPNFLLQTLFFRISLRYLPRNPLLYGVIFVLIVLFHILLYFNIEKLYKLLERLLRDSKIRVLSYLLISIIFFSTLIILLNVDWVYALFSDFITDKYLIFNWNMYNTLLIRIKEWITWPIYYLAFVCLIGLFFIKDKKVKLISYTFFVTAFIYFVLISKVLYFHEYYFHIIIICLVIFASSIYLLIKSFNSKYQKLAIIILFIVILLPLNYNEIDKNLSKQRPGSIEVANYLNLNMGSNEFFIIGNGVSSAVSLYSNRKSLFDIYSFPYNKNLTNTFRSEVSSGKTLPQLMKDYKVKFYVSNGPITYNNGLVYLFTSDFDSEINSSQRTDIILCKENNYCTGASSQDKSKKQSVYDNNIKQYLRLDKQIGNYYIYRFY